MKALEGDFVRLESLGLEHVDGLFAAATEAAGRCIPFAQVRIADQTVVGATRFLNLRRRTPDEPPFAVEIGGTWLAPWPEVR